MTTAVAESLGLIGSFHDIVFECVARLRSHGRVVVCAPTGRDHAEHVAVEFLHPVIAGKRSLPAVVVSVDELDDIAEPDDVIVLIGPDHAALEPCRQQLHHSQWRVELVGDDMQLIRTYHLLWEGVHVALEHGDRPSQQTDLASTTLYPFLTAQGGTAVNSWQTALMNSTQEKLVASLELCRATVTANRTALDDVASLLRARRGSARLLTMGNGGSACDAARLARVLRRQGFASTCLADQYATLSALGNDIGTQRTFSRLVEAMGRGGDVVVGLSTSGDSSNVVAGFETARRGGMTTVGIAGYQGGRLAEPGVVDHLLVVASESVHRIQEAQAALVDALTQRLSDSSHRGAFR